MKLNPAGGNVRPIKSGKLEGVLCRRAGDYRIVFSLDSIERVIEIAAIVPRSEKTYR